jgi:hypothetical protein
LLATAGAAGSANGRAICVEFAGLAMMTKEARSGRRRVVGTHVAEGCSPDTQMRTRAGPSHAARRGSL